MRNQINKKIDLDLIIYPSSGGEKGYEIQIRRNVMLTMLKELGVHNNKFILADVLHQSQKRLSNIQVRDIENLMQILNKIEKSDEDSIGLDVFVFSLKVNGEKITSFTSNRLLSVNEISSEQTKTLNKLVKTIIKLSPLEIDFTKL